MAEDDAEPDWLTTAGIHLQATAQIVGLQPPDQAELPRPLAADRPSQPAASPRQATFMKHAGVRACHCCGKPIFNSERAIRCGNSRQTLANGRPVCSKSVCRDCFEEYGWRWADAQDDPEWTCPHCREVCPKCAHGDPFASGDLAASEGLRAQLQNSQRASQFWALLKEIERAQEQGASQQGQPAVSGRRDAARCEAPWPEVCRPQVCDHGAAAAAAAAEEESRIGGWGSPAVGGDAWGHAAGAGALVGLTSGEGGALRVRHVAVLVGGQCSGGEAAGGTLVHCFDPLARAWLPVHQRGNPPGRLRSHAAAAFGASLVLCGGGDGKRISSELFTLTLRDASQDAPTALAGLGAAAAAVASAAMAAAGGAPSAVSAEWAHPQVRGAPPPPCVGHCVARLGVNGLVLFGGFAGSTIGATTALHPLCIRHPPDATPFRMLHPLVCVLHSLEGHTS